jgi:hypothetical protein
LLTLPALRAASTSAEEITKGKRILSVIPFLLTTHLFFSPIILGEIEGARYYSREEVRAIEILRLVASAQEQFRINNGFYALTTEAVDDYIDAGHLRSSLELSANANNWWSGTIRNKRTECTIFVGTPYLSFGAELDGVPSCKGRRVLRARNQMALGVPFTKSAEENPEKDILKSTWPQHRGNPARSGVAAGIVTGFTWIVHHNGELRSSVSVAGGQVFAGSHGNGEIATYQIEDGKLLWRIRAPNWIHHEPVAGTGFLVYGFGNNEPLEKEKRF